jgi:hypothetical protein
MSGKIADAHVIWSRRDSCMWWAGQRNVRFLLTFGRSPPLFGRPMVRPRSTLDKVFRHVLRTRVGTGRHPGPLYGVTALDLALAAWYAAHVGELHALAQRVRPCSIVGATGIELCQAESVVI